VIISNSHKFIFIHIRKTAGEAVTATLEPHLRRGDSLPDTDPRRWLGRSIKLGSAPYPSLTKHSSAVEIRGEVPSGLWNDYYKFAIVRHPVDRMVSFYQWAGRIHAQRNSMRPQHVRYYLTESSRRGEPNRWPAVQAYSATDSFAEFIRHPLIADSHDMHDQANVICDPEGRILVDFVAHFEQIDEDFRQIQQAIGLPCHVLTRTNVSSSGHDRPVVTQEDEEYLGGVFRRDFDLFGYKI
jgi:Sulfotransferase family